MPKYALDTNIYIDAFRSTDASETLKQFLTSHLPMTYLSAVVMMELRIGAQTKDQVEAVEKAVFAPFEKRRRVFAPSLHAFKEAGTILALLVKNHPVNRPIRSSLVNDALLAASCREQGLTLITSDNDFLRISRHLKGFRYVAPWP